MMKRLLMLVLLALVLGSSAMAQERFLVKEKNLSRAALLSRVASIDSRHDSLYVVYANEQEQKAMRELGFDYQTMPEPEAKALTVSTTVEELRQWNSYPSYDTYVQFMQQLVQRYPALCWLDTIGTSVQGRLILCLKLTSAVLADSAKPQFFYSSTIHGDEITGYYLMLRLADTLLSGYGTVAQYTALLDSVQVFINPLANPDGTYRGGNNNVSGSRRYNANSVDLNRNYPDPFGSDPLSAQQVENTAMINYFQQHQFRLSANLHGGSEVLNYPWDSFTSYERPHPSAPWWRRVCKKFIDTLRTQSQPAFDDVTSSGYIEGGDWYVIPNGRQDWVNYTMGCLEMTMEVSSTKTLGTQYLPVYWQGLQRPLVNYIHSILRDTAFIMLPQDTVPVVDTTTPTDTVSISILSLPPMKVYPNPTTGIVMLQEDNAASSQQPLRLYDMEGRLLATYPANTTKVEIKQPSGVYILRQGTRVSRIIKY